MRSATPWIVAVRASTMEVVYNNLAGLDALKNAAADIAASP